MAVLQSITIARQDVLLTFCKKHKNCTKKQFWNQLKLKIDPRLPPPYGVKGGGFILVETHFLFVLHLNKSILRYQLEVKIQETKI